MNEESRLRARPALIGMRSNAGPLEDVSVRFEAGVTALYGQNGAGKTWILNALRGSLRGHHTAATQLLCEFAPGSIVFDWVMQNISEVLRETRYSTLATPEEDKALLLSRLHEWFLRGGTAFRPYDDEDEVPEELITELTSANVIALVPRGTTVPEWDVWLCMSRDALEFPVATRALGDFELKINQFDDLEERLKLVHPEYLDDPTELSEEEYTDRENAAEILIQEQQDLHWSYRYEPIAGWTWEYYYRPSPDQVRRWVEIMAADDLPIPLVKLFTARDMPLVLEDEADSSDLDAATAGAFAAHFEQVLGATKEVLVLDEQMKKWAAEVNGAANEIYGELLQDAPELTLELRSPGKWVTGAALHWYVEFGSQYRKAKVAISELSRAENRWARVAVRRALDSEESTSALIIDEPEAALHRAAERHMARGLDGLPTLGPQVFVATHSPEVLNTDSTKCIHVSKLDGRTRVGQIPSVGPETLAELGLVPSDLLGLYRIFLLVEGEHDDVVIRTLCGDFLDEARVKIIPMRGARNLPGTLESEILFDLSDAHLVAILDDVDAHEINEVWLEAQTRHLSGDLDGAIEFLTQALRGRKGSEYGWISSWLSKALKKGVHGRMEPYGLAARDIVEYLPVDLMVPGASGKSWELLRREHEQAVVQTAANRGPRDFKSWLSGRYRADTSVSNVRRAAESMNEIPEEFRLLGYRLREISARPRS